MVGMGHSQALSAVVATPAVGVWAEISRVELPSGALRSWSGVIAYVCVSVPFI